MKNIRLSRFLMAACVGVAGLAGALIVKAITVNAPTVSGITETSATISWTTDVPTNTCIKMGTVSGALYKGCNTDGPTTSHSFYVTNMMAGTTYYYVAGYDDPSPEYFLIPEQSFTTSGSSGGGGGGGPTPASPTGFVAVSDSTPKVSLSWNDASTNEDGFMVYREVPNSMDWNQIVDQPTNSKSSMGTQYTWLDYGVTAGATYNYKVLSYVGSGGTTRSPEVYYYSVYIPGASVSPSPSTSWVSRIWTFKDGTSQSYILNRTDTTYTDYIASIAAQCLPLTLAQWGSRWKPNAGNDQYWQEFGIPECSTTASPMPSSSYTPSPSPSPSSSTGPISVSVTQPTGGACIPNNSTLSIHWSVSGDISQFDFYALSYWEGNTWKQAIGSTFPKTQTMYSWVAPSAANTNYAQIKVEAWKNNNTMPASTYSSIFSVKSTCSSPASSPSYTPSPSPSTSWVSRIWTFKDGTSQSYILNRTDTTYTDYIASIAAQCLPLTLAQWGSRWKPNAGNDQYWQEFGIPECSTTASPMPSSSPSATPYPSASPYSSPSPSLTTVKTIKGKVTLSTGAPVTDANVDAWRQDTGMAIKSSTDANGNYALSVYGGSWQVGIYPKSGSAAWAYSQPPRWVSFSADDAAETRQIDFSVFAASSRVRGAVKNADGSVPAQAFVGVESGTGFNQGGPLASDGSFGFGLPPGSYTLHIFQEGQGSVGDPMPFTLGDSETKDFGVIVLAVKSSSITGIVKDTAGHALANIPVRAFIQGTSNFAQTTTKSDGIYALHVTPGVWTVRAEPYAESSYANPDPPISVTVAAGGLTQANFKLVFSDTVISGTVVDDITGTVLTDFYGYVAVGDFSSQANFGGAVTQGSFSFMAQSGTHQVRLGISPDSGYAPPPLQTITVAPGATKIVTFRVARNASLITGQIKDNSGALLKNLQIRIAASNGAGVWQEGFYNPDTGSYRISISRGTWYLGVSTENLTGYASPDRASLVVSVEQGKSVVKDITLARVGASRIVGIVRKPDGSPFPHAFVTADVPYGGSAQIAQGAYSAGYGAETDSRGAYNIPVPPGSWRVRAFAPPSLGFQNPEAIDVAVANGEVRSADLLFRSSSAVISGKIEGITGKAFVYAWSDKGGYAETESAEDGSYTLNVTENESWKVGVSTEIDKTLFRASDTHVAVGRDDVVGKNLVAIPMAKKLPDAVSTVGETTQVNIVGVKDGASIVVPPNALMAAGKVTITVTPDTRAATQSNERVVGIGYAIEIRGQDAKSITNLNADAVVSIPYTDADIAAAGVSPKNLSMSFWDESTGAWRAVSNSVVDATSKVVSGSVGHLTRFALVAPADTQPPDPPYNVSIASMAGGFKVAWGNPTFDFHHAKIYRSSTKGVLGSLIADNISVLSYSDLFTKEAGVTYYYVVRVIDLAGNESTNTTQYTLAGAAQTPSQKELGPQAIPSSTTIIATSSVPAPNPQIPAYQKYANSSLLRANDDAKVWIIMNGFKRYVVGPSIFNFYGHLKNAPVIDVPKEELDQYALAAWVRYVNSPKVYEVNDDATKHWLDMSADDFYNTGRRWEAVFVVNKAEIDFYKTGVNVTVIK